MPSTTASSKTPAKASSRTKAGKTFKITIVGSTGDSYMSTPKKVADNIVSGYWLSDYFTDWAVQVEPATREDLEAAL